MLLFDLPGDVGARLRNLTSARLFLLLLCDLLIELDSRLALQVESGDVFQLLLLASVVLLSL